MIEESGVVVALEGDFAWVETDRKSSCGGCSAKQGCGTAVLGKVLGQKRARVRAINTLDLMVGDTVVIGVEEQALVKGSLFIYLVPLLLMFTLAMIGQNLSLQWQMAGEGVTILFSLTGLLLGFVAVRKFSKQIERNRHYQAEVLRKDGQCIAAIAISKII